MCYNPNFLPQSFSDAPYTPLCILPFYRLVVGGVWICVNRYLEVIVLTSNARVVDCKCFCCRCFHALLLFFVLISLLPFVVNKDDYCEQNLKQNCLSNEGGSPVNVCIWLLSYDLLAPWPWPWPWHTNESLKFHTCLNCLTYVGLLARLFFATHRLSSLHCLPQHWRHSNNFIIITRECGCGNAFGRVCLSVCVSVLFVSLDLESSF